MPEHTNPPSSKSDAEFLGWQESLNGEKFPLYTITVAEHPSYHSTVTDAALRRLRLRIPRTPSPYPDIGPSLWHTVGIELDNPRTAREAIEMSGLDFTVVKKKLDVNAGLRQDAYAMVRTDTGDVLGIVGKSYEPIQNRDAFTFFDALVEEQEAVYETAGSLGLGERIWILAKLPGYIKVHGNDIVNKYLLLTNSHDGSVPVRAKLNPIRAVCNNTLTSALEGAGDTHNRFTANTAQHLEQAVALLSLTTSSYEKLDTIFNIMAAKKITTKHLEEYIQTLVPDNEEQEDKAATAKTRNDMLQLYESGWGAQLARGTLWGAFNCVTEYADHKMLDEEPSKQLTSIWFGRGEQFKLKAFHLAEQIMRA